MAWEGSTRSERLPANWPKMRRRILERDGYICHVCGYPGADEVDHLRAGDDHRDENLGAIHNNPCHRAKSSGEGGRAAAFRRREQATRPREQHPGLL